MENKRAGGFFRRYWRELLCFFLPIALLIVYNLIRFRQMWIFIPDARLYLSVADNFLATGHFIESSRGSVWVVPFGLPLILTVFRSLHMSTEGIVVVQYAMIGFTSLLIYKAEQNYFGRGGRAPIVYFLMLFREQIVPWNIFTELYFLFFLACILWLLSRKDMPPAKRVLWLNVAGFAAYAVRTVLIVVYVPILIYTLISLRRGQISGRRTALLFLIPALLVGANTAVNHRETGHWIVSNNYGGRDIYLANNPYAGTTEFLTYSEIGGFVGEEYYAIQNDETLDFTEKNQAFQERAAAWIRSDPGTFLKNTAVKFYRVFFLHWLGLLLPPVIFALVWGVRKKDRLMLGMLCLGFLLAVISSMGPAVPRYSAPLFPLVAMQYAAGWELLGELWARIRRGEGPAGTIEGRVET